MTNVSDLQKKALLFAGLHRGPRILILANAWDAARARIFEVAGFPAIANLERREGLPWLTKLRRQTRNGKSN